MKSPHILVLGLVATCAIALTSFSIERMVSIALSYRKTATLKRASNMRLTAALGVDIVAVVILLLCYDNSITSVRRLLHIGEVDNNVIELCVATSNTCTSFGRPSWKKVGTQHSKWKVETGIRTCKWVRRSFSLAILIDKSNKISLTAY